MSLVGYGFGDFACNLSIAMTTTFLLFYMTDVAGVSAAAVGTMAGRAGCVQRCTARRITRLRQRLRQFRDRARGRECRRAAEQHD